MGHRRRRIDRRYAGYPGRRGRQASMDRRGAPCNRGTRASGGGVVEAFNDGYAKLGTCRGIFSSSSMAICRSNLRTSHAASSTLRQSPILVLAVARSVSRGRERHVESPGDPPFHVRGATKIYRRECWAQIGPLVKAPGWDTVDEVKANMHGWTTRSFPKLPLMQHKPTGTADGAWRTRSRTGVPTT